MLVTTVAAGGVGLNLTQASRAVFFEPLLDLAAFRQAIGRVHRIGQKRSVAVHVLAVAGTHEHIALDLVTKRMNATDDEADQRALKQQRLCTTLSLGDAGGGAHGTIPSRVIRRRPASVSTALRRGKISM